MWFKYGLKAQKLLAQGITLGISAIRLAPCKGKSFICLVNILTTFEKLNPYAIPKRLYLAYVQQAELIVYDLYYQNIFQNSTCFLALICVAKE